MRILFLFLDGVGLGADDPRVNPLAATSMPTLRALLGGRPLTASGVPFHGARASLLALDACLGVAGRPQSASGQAALLTGRNIPAAIGGHYGPKPNPAIAAHLQNGNLFAQLRAAGRRVAYLNAFPPRYFAALESGRRLPGAIAMAARAAGVPLRTVHDLQRRQALSPDFTNHGWREHLGYPDLPLLSPPQAGARLAALAQAHDFTLLEHWPTDLAGHRQDALAARDLLTTLDGVLAGLLSAWDADRDLILLTSDHGNLEDLSTRRHTTNPVPLLLIGPEAARRAFAPARDLTDLAPILRRLLAA